MQDPLLRDLGAKKPTDASYGIDPQDIFLRGLAVARISREELDRLIWVVSAMYDNKTRLDRRDPVTRTAANLFRGGIFALATREMGNIEWKEHCASSFRELFHEWDGNPIRAAEYDLFNKDRRDEVSGFLANLHTYYSYFTGICHHHPKKVAGNAQALLRAKGEDGSKYDAMFPDEVFLVLVGDFFRTLSSLASATVEAAQTL